MKGKMKIVTKGGQSASCEVFVTPNKGVNEFEIVAKAAALKDEIKFNEATKFRIFLLLPSRMNERGFRIDEP